MTDDQLIECHAKLPQPAFRFDRDQFRYNEEIVIFNDIGNLSCKNPAVFTFGIQHYRYASFSSILNKSKHVYHSQINSSNENLLCFKDPVYINLIDNQEFTLKVSVFLRPSFHARYE